MQIVYGSFVSLVSDPQLWALMLPAIVMGMVLGAVPGIGGKVGIVLALPFVFHLDLVPGAVFLVAMHAVVHTGGAIPSILLGIPGSGPDAATVCDGFPMTRNGEAGRALGASLAASAAGGIIGAACLAALMPVVEPAILALGPAEFFFLAVFGITLVGAVSGDDLGKGVVVGLFGVMVSFVGTEPQTGTERFAMAWAPLANGIDIVTAMLGIFAVPECLLIAAHGLLRAPVPVNARRAYRVGELLTGVADVGRHWGLTVRTSVIGAVIGIIPGLGGDVASWICYGHAAQTARHPERFGQGAVEGVIGPEAANNSKEGGALLPTLFFGIPGSSGMALMLGAFIMLGLQPGPAVATEQLDFVWILIWTLVVSNVVAALLFLGAARWLVLVLRLRAGLFVPIVLLFSTVGAYMAAGRESLLLLVAFGLFGLGLVRGGWPRSPFVIGLILGPVMEISLHQAVTIYGTSFVLRPIALALVLATAVSVALCGRRAARRPPPTTAPQLSPLVAGGLCAACVAMVVAALTYPPPARFVPLVVGVPAAALAARAWLKDAGRVVQRPAGVSPVAAPPERDGFRGLAWLSAFVLLVLAGGFSFGGPVAVVLTQRFWLKESWRSAALSGGLAWALVSVLSGPLRVGFFEGWIEAWLRA